MGLHHTLVICLQQTVLLVELVLLRLQLCGLLFLQSLTQAAHFLFAIFFRCVMLAFPFLEEVPVLHSPLLLKARVSFVCFLLDFLHILSIVLFHAIMRCLPFLVKLRIFAIPFLMHRFNAY